MVYLGNQTMIPKAHDYLVERARDWLVAGGGCRFAFAEFSTWLTRDIPDALGFMEDGLTVMVECKVSRSDFHADKKKPSRQNGKPLAHYQYYLCERGLITPEDLEPLKGDWGLLWIKSSRAVSIIRHPKRATGLRYGQDKNFARAEDYARYVMTSALFRAEKKGLIPRLNRAFDKHPPMPLGFGAIKYENFGAYWNPKYIGPI